MRVLIDSDEWYPVYSLREMYGLQVEVTQDQLDRWTRVFNDFDSVQAELAILHGAAEEIARKKALAEKEAREKEAREKAKEVIREQAKAQKEFEKQQAEVQRLLTASSGLVYTDSGELIGRIESSRLIPMAGDSDE